MGFRRCTTARWNKVWKLWYRAARIYVRTYVRLTVADAGREITGQIRGIVRPILEASTTSSWAETNVGEGESSLGRLVTITPWVLPIGPFQSNDRRPPPISPTLSRAVVSGREEDAAEADKIGPSVLKGTLKVGDNET